MNKLFFLLVTSLYLSQPAYAQTEPEAGNIFIGSQGSPDQPTPSHGQDQKQVRALYGEPLDFSGPVGEPPITTWHYAGFSVYFENNIVIHIVKRR